MQAVSEIITKIQSVKPILSKNGIDRIGLFGSVLRGENQDESDLDLLIHFRSGFENFNNFNQAYDILEAAFPDTRLDLVTINGLSPFIGPHILAEVLYV